MQQSNDKYHSHKLSLRRGTREDMPAVHRLICELAEFEQAAGEVKTHAAGLAEDGFGRQACFRTLLAEYDQQLVGMAMYYPAYSSWKGKMLYLDDLIVSKEYRNRGIGHALFRELMREVRREGAHQLRWHVLHWNERAIDFYRDFDAQLDREWVSAKLELSQINKILSR